MKKLVRMMAVYALTGAVVVSSGMMSYASDTADKEEKIATLESEKADLEERVTQLESENAALQEQIDALQNPETEAQTEPSTEIVGTQYTDSATVQIVQQALNDAGFDCGNPDGKAGAKTQEALKAYQQSKGINVNGVITDELLETMGIADQVSEAAKLEASKAEYSSDYSYNTIARDAESYKDTKVKFRGKVLQEGSFGIDGMNYIRFAVDSNYDTVLFVTYTTDQVSGRILEDDILTIYGTVVGDYSYETVMGATVTLPWVLTQMIDTSEVNMN